MVSNRLGHRAPASTKPPSFPGPALHCRCLDSWQIPFSTNVSTPKTCAPLFRGHISQRAGIRPSLRMDGEAEAWV